MADLTPQQWEEIEQALYQGRKIQAIKLYRQTAGLDLKTSKDLIEVHERALRADFPDRFTAPSGGAGCSTKAAIFLILASGLIFLFLA